MRTRDDQSINRYRTCDDVAIFFVERQKRQIDAAILHLFHQFRRGAVAKSDLNRRMQRVKLAEQQRKVEKRIEAGAGPDFQRAALEPARSRLPLGEPPERRK